MANIQASVAGWSTTEGSNQPDGTDTLTVAADMRAIQAAVRYDNATRASITAASTTDLSTITAGIVQVDNTSGTTTITALGTVSSGIKKFLVFNITGGSVSMTHNATSLILPGGVSISCADKDCALVESLGSGNWKMHYYAGGGVSTIWTGVQKVTPLTDNDGSFDMTARNDFVCTPSAGITLTFTNITSGQRGMVYLDNSGAYTISMHSAILAGPDVATDLSVAGKYKIAYWSPNGTDVAISYSPALT